MIAVHSPEDEGRTLADAPNRRPLRSRGTAWAKRLASVLALERVPPDTISLMGLAFALVGASSLALSGSSFGFWRGLLMVLAAVCILLRLLCNLLDGMVAVEHGRSGRLGPLWNELPNRVSDIVLFAAAGYGAIHAGHDGGPALGWLCAVLALLTAYVRELGRSLGFEPDFCGPMAKPQRMVLLCVAALVSASEGSWPIPDAQGRTLYLALGLIAALSVLTVVRRLRRLANRLKARD